MGFTGIPRALAEWVATLNPNPHALIAILAVIYILLGTALDGISMIVLTTSIVLPMVQKAGFDLVWFGIFIVLLVEIAEVTPPLGFNMFVLQTMSGRDSNYVALASIPFFFMMVLALALLVIFPEIATWLPDALIAKQKATAPSEGARPRRRRDRRRHRALPRRGRPRGDRRRAAARAARSRRASPTPATSARATRRRGRPRDALEGAEVAAAERRSARVRWRADADLLGWMGSWLANCSRASFERNKPRMQRLALQPRLPAASSARRRHPLRRDALGILQLMRTEREFAALPATRILAAAGIPHRCSRRRACEIEPALAHAQVAFAGGCICPLTRPATASSSPRRLPSTRAGAASASGSRRRVEG